MQWLKSTVSLLIVFTWSISFAGNLQDAKDKGMTLGNQFLGKYGSKDGISKNASQPLMSSSTNMTTLDGKKSFNAQLLCPSSSSYLSVFVQPSSSGDLSLVRVRQDTDMDSNLDYTYEVPTTVSGICANGVISCNSGTWSNCSYLKWSADTSGIINLTSVLITELSGCYCINSSCGSNLVWKNISFVLKDLGGGIAGAIQAINPKFAISSVNVDGTLITYYGQDSAKCSNVAHSSGSATPEKYFNNPYAVAGDVATESIQQASDPGSYYYTLSNSLAAQKNMSEYSPCTIRRTLSCIADSTDYEEHVTSSCESLETDPQCKLKNEHVDNVTIYRNFSPTSLVPLETCGSITCQISEPCTNTIDYTESLSNSGVLNLCNTSETPIVSYSTYVPQGNALIVNVNLTNDSCEIGFVRTVVIKDPSGDIVASGSSELCAQTYRFQYNAAISGNHNVSIFSQPGGVGATNCTNYINIGASAQINKIKCPLDDTLQCQGDIHDSHCTQAITHNICTWWEKKRDYLCDKGSKYDFTDLQTRMQKIVSTTSDGTGALTYTDYTKDKDGNWISTSSTAALPGRDPFSSCQKACKTRIPKKNTQVSTSGHKKKEQKDNFEGYDFFYKTCSNDICIIDSLKEEEIVKTCQCINDFAEATALLQTLRSAGKDFLCSDGTSKPLE